MNSSKFDVVNRLFPHLGILPCGVVLATTSSLYNKPFEILGYRVRSFDMDHCRVVPGPVWEEDLNKKDKFCYFVDWFDPIAQINKSFILSYYYLDSTVELFDVKQHRQFLRRTKVDGLAKENMYKGAIVSVLSRQLKIMEYGDKKTRETYEVLLSSTFCMVKPDVVPRVGEVITFMQEHNLRITQLKMGLMTVECAHRLYHDLRQESFFPFLINYVTGGPCVAMSAIGEDAMNRWREYIGPTDASEAKRTAPNSLRAIYGTDISRNGVHGSKDLKHIELESSEWFPKVKTEKVGILPTCILKNTTCGIVRPHAVIEGSIGPILNYIFENGFRVTAMEMFTLDVPLCEEFFEVYKGVIPEFAAMITEMSSGPCLVMEVLDLNSECTPETFRKLVGPSDPEIARKLRPHTIRAKFGKTKVLNAIHCTDLPDDAQLELEYFFKILQCA